MTAIRRCVLTAVPFGGAAVAYVGVFLARYDRLPGRIATHFSGGGGADDFMSRTAALWSGAGLILGLGALFSVLSLVSKESTGARLLAAAGAATAVMLGYPLVITVLINTDVQDPAAVRLPLWHLAVLLLAGAVTGVLAWWLVGAGPRPAPVPPALALPLAEGEAAAWSRTMISRALLFPAAATTLGGLAALVSGLRQAGVPLLVAGLCALPLAGVRVAVDRRGLTVASMILPRPRLAVPLARVSAAGSLRISAMADFGGWGYRILPNRRGVVLRSGEALSVRTVAGREYVVTVDDATTAAALLNGLVERHARERG
ncbi:DUF1648 domain-containing protein [Streptomyces sp. NPDC047017]|uniref:DUF1648 domain-containing protein n=1 Tax=Streptomyces sp. NPDC047017 TaxID=3155024 RepID=UPI0033F47DA2